MASAVGLAGRLGLGEGLDQPRERAVVDAPAGLGRRDREADRQVRFPDAGRPGNLLYRRRYFDTYEFFLIYTVLANSDSESLGLKV